MTKKVRRSIFKQLFLDYEKEEKWLNDMCKNGYALSNFENWYYIFEACEPGEYIYYISLLHEDTLLKKKATLITSINRWYYFRSKSPLGEFSIEEDIHAKINYYKRVSLIWYILAAICILFAVTDFIVITWMSIPEQSYLFNLFFLVIGFLFLRFAYPLTKKVRRLRVSE